MGKSFSMSLKAVENKEKTWYNIIIQPKNAMTMNITTLIEDTPGVRGCLYERGLCFYIETAHQKSSLTPVFARSSASC